MADQDFERATGEFDEVADWLRAQRLEVSEHDLDRIKLQAKSQAAKPAIAPRRTLSAALAALVLAMGFGGALAIAGKGPPASPGAGSANSSAGASQYKPGKGCGDKNNTHDRENECKKTSK